MERYKLRAFSKWAKTEGLSDNTLTKAVDEMNRGLVGSPLGSEVFKKRVPLSGRGKRGGARTILIFKRGEMALFLYGYSKNEKANLTREEEEAARVYAKEFLGLNKTERRKRVSEGALIKIED